MKRYLFGILAVACTFAIFAFKSAERKFVNYYFEYNSTAGNEATPSNWQHVMNPTGCSSSGASCKIEISDAYVTVPGGGGDPFIDPTKLAAFGGTLPVQPGSGANQVPDLTSGAYVNSFNQAP